MGLRLSLAKSLTDQLNFLTNSVVKLVRSEIISNVVISSTYSRDVNSSVYLGLLLNCINMVSIGVWHNLKFSDILPNKISISEFLKILFAN